MSGTVAQNVNIFILLYFSQEDLVFKQAIEKEQNLVRNWYKLSLKSLILSPGQFCSAFITKGIIPEVSWFQIELFSWPHSNWLIMSPTFFFLALWEHQNFCLRFLFLKYFYIICDWYWYDVCVINSTSTSQDRSFANIINFFNRLCVGLEIFRPFISSFLDNSLNSMILNVIWKKKWALLWTDVETLNIKIY